MSQGTCLVCFSVTKILDIKYTHLQNVYEELSNSEIKADSHPLCYICCAKLHQCEKLLTQINENNSVSQPEVRPLVHLNTVNTDNNWYLPNNDIEIEFQPKVKQEYINEENVQSNPDHCTDETEIRIEYIKDEYIETSPGHCEDDAVVETHEHKHTPTELQTTQEPENYHVSTEWRRRKRNGVENQKQMNEDAESELNQKRILEILELQCQQEIKKLEKNTVLLDLEIELKKVQLKNARMELELKKCKLFH